MHRGILYSVLFHTVVLTVGVPVDLPKTRASQMVGQDEPLVISVDAEGSLYLQDTEIELGQLVPSLKAITDGRPS